MAAAAVIVAMLAVSSAFVWFQLRHLALTALVIVPPFAIAALGAFDKILPFLGMFSGGVAHFFAAVCAFAACDRIVFHVCRGLMPRAAMHRALRDLLAAAGPPLIAYALSTLALFGGILTWSFGLTHALSALAAFGLAAALSWFAAWMPYPESFIARANLALEWRERAMERLSFIAQTRWALSVSGIGLIFAALAAFSIRAMSPNWGGVTVWPYACAATMFALPAFVMVTRDWRSAFALTLSGCLIAAAQLAASLAYKPVFAFLDLVELCPQMLFAIVPLGLLGARLRRALHDGDDLAGGLLLAIREEGGWVLNVGFFWIVLSVVTSGLTSPWPGVVFGAVLTAAALLLFPALAVAINALFPRYRSVEDVFGKK